MTSDIESSLKRLSAAYAEHLPVKVEELDILWSTMKNSPSKELLDTLILKSHTLCGSSGTYGYKLVSEVTRKLENKLSKAKQTTLSMELKNEIDNLVSDLNQLSLTTPQSKLIPIETDSNHFKNDQRLIYLLDDDESTKNIFEKIKQFEYSGMRFDNVAEFINATRANHPSFVVININFAEEIPLTFFEEIREELISIIFLGNQDDFNTRLLTVRRGGQSFLSKPFEISTLLRMVDNLFEAKKIENEKVLIVDDSHFLADYFSMLLNQVGMLTCKVTDPKIFLATLQEFQPDLILMDINMPYCTGTELAQIVQQQENLNGIPIIFLSSISEKSKQLEVMSYAGDDFLVKPVDPKFLIAAVRNRLMRSRMLRYRIMRDSLTNLYNHTMIHHQLEREILIADRYKKDVSVVLIDLDFFKNINDTYGHQAGDKVLKDLSAFLKTNLRKMDLIGRYGGEEFLVVLPNTPAQEALKIMDQLRAKFAATPHVLNEKEVYITLSAGISSYPTLDKVSTIIRAADKALYKAKDLGRNKVLIAGG